MTNRPPAILAGLMLAAFLSAALPAPVAASSCSSTPSNSPGCSFQCEKGSGTSVTISTPNGGYVEAGASCPASSAHCTGPGSCSGSGPVEQTSGSGHCSGWADNGNAVVGCSGGGSDSLTDQVLSQACNGILYTAMGLTSLTVLFVNEDPAMQAQSFNWTKTNGCVSVKETCTKGIGIRLVKCYL